MRRPTLAQPLGPTIGMLLESLATKNDNSKNIIAYIVVFEPSICYYTSFASLSIPVSLKQPLSKNSLRIQIKHLI